MSETPMNSLNWADWIIIAIVIVSMLISIKRGFVKEALSLVNLLLALFIAWVFAPLLAPKLYPALESATFRYLAALAILFISSLLLGAALNFIIASLLKAGGLSGTDRFLGTLFGAARGLVIVMTLVVFLPKLLPVEEDNWWQESRTIPALQSFEGDFTKARLAVQSSIMRLFNRDNAERLRNAVPERYSEPPTDGASGPQDADSQDA